MPRVGVFLKETWLCCSGENRRGVSQQHWAEKVAYCSEFNEMLCNNVEENNSESRADDCGLACGVLEGRKDSVGAIYVEF